MKTVYLVQHGIALTKDVDADRPLSDAGIFEVRRVAEHLRNHGVSVSRIYHSGKLRAQQTAEVFAQILTCPEVTEHTDMDPNDPPCTLITQLKIDRAMYVGHLPHMQKVVSQLIADNENAQAIIFQNAAVACVEIDQGRAALNWFITPELC